MFSGTKKTNLPNTTIKALIENEHHIFIVTNLNEKFILLEKKEERQKYQRITGDIRPPRELEQGESYKYAFMFDPSYASFSSFFYLTKSGRVFAHGLNKPNQLGLGYGSKPHIENASLVPLPIGEKAISMAGYNKSTFIHCKSGNLYAFGNNREGQLLLGHKNPVYIPTLVENISEMRLIVIKEENLKSESPSYSYSYSSSYSC